MKDSLASLELHYLVAELQRYVGARFDKVYQGFKERKRDLTLQFNKSGIQGKSIVRVLLPGIAYLAEEKPAYEQLPGSFAVYLRKHVGNARLLEIRQRGFERILELVLEKKEGKYILLIELLPPGNALLLNEEGKILNLLEPQRHGQRVLRGGAEYVLPPENFDTRNASEEAIVERLAATDKDSIVKALATDLAFGKAYAEEICARAKIEKTRSDLEKTELQAVAKIARSLFDQEPAPFSAGGAVYPFTMESVAAETGFSSFSLAIEQAIMPTLRPAVAATEPKKTKKEKEKDVVVQQEQALAGYLKGAEENQAKGELIYENYQLVDRLLKEINEARKKMEWKDVKELFKDRVTKIDESKGEITIEL